MTPRFDISSNGKRTAAFLVAMSVMVSAKSDPITLTVSTVNSSGANTSLATAQNVNLDPATNLSLFNTDLGNFNTNVNGDTVSQLSPNYSLATAQGVSPQFFPLGSPFVAVSSNVEALGSIGPSSTQEYYGFNTAVGDQIHVAVNSTTPSGRAAELLLYDQDNNLVAIADGNQVDGVSSVIDYTVQPGGAGSWHAEVISGDGNPTPFDYNLQFGLPFGATSAFTTNVIGNGAAAPGDPTDLGFYGISVNAADNLVVAVSSIPSGARGPELLLYDQDGNIVAIADGNQPDDISSIIDYTIPTGDTGTWYAEVSPGDGDSTPFPYDLMTQGATALGPVNPLPTTTNVSEPPPWSALIAGLTGLWCFARRRNP